MMRRIVFFSLVLLVVAGCATQKDAAASFNATNVSAACTNNVYLKKYNCSAEQVQQAAEQGDADAQYALGYMYYYGIGITGDPQTAQLWISKSAAQGQPLAEKALAIMKGSTTEPTTTLAASKTPSVGQNTVDFVAAKTGYVKAISPRKTVVDARLASNAMPNSATAGHVQSAQAKAKTKTKTSLKRSRSQLKSAVTHPRLAGPVHIESMTANIPRSGYTLQLMGSHSMVAVKLFVARHHLSGDLRVFETQYRQAPWFSLVYGQYSSVVEAKAALKQMPRALRARRPWVKSFGTIKQEIKQHRVLS